MPTTKIPVWIRSEYVTIGQPPFHEDQGTKKLPPVMGADRLPYIGSATVRIPRIPPKSKARFLGHSEQRPPDDFVYHFGGLSS